MLARTIARWRDLTPIISRWRDLAPPPPLYKKDELLRRAVLADTVKGRVVRGDGEARFGKLCQPDLWLVFDQHVEDSIADFADEMLMALYQRIEMLRPAEHQHLQFFIGHQFLQIAVNGAETDAGQLFSAPDRRSDRRWDETSRL